MRVHSIFGYEWECSECHYHFFRGIPEDDECEVCGRQVTEEEDGEYVDSAGRVTNHSELVSRAEAQEQIDAAGASRG